MRAVWILLVAATVVVGTAAEAQRTSTERASGQNNLGEYSGIRHALGVTDFSNDAGWRGRWDLGRNLSIMLESALNDTDRFVLVDRNQLGNVIREQDLAASGRTAQAQGVAQTGKIRPAKYIASGSITEVEHSASGKDGGIGFGGIRIGGKREEAQVTAIIKITDSTTGEIVAQERVIGRAGRTGLKIGIRRGGFSGDLGGFEKTPLGEAAQDVIDQAAEFIASEMEDYPAEGNVIRVANNGQILINRGAEYGITTGQEMVMRTMGEEIIDPMTGAVLGVERGQVMGRLRVVRVEDKFSYCEVVEGEGNPETGAVVYMQ